MAGPHEKEPESGSFKLPGKNMLAFLLAGALTAGTGGGVGAWVSPGHTNSDKTDQKLDQILDAQKEAKAFANDLKRSQDDMRNEITGLKSAGTDEKVNKHDERLRAVENHIAAIEALLRERK